MEETKYPESRISPYTVGFDFGTCNSSVAVFKRGEVELLKVDGGVIIPSVVSFREGKGPLIGAQAKRSALLYPERTVSSIKMELGNPEWKFTHADKDHTAADIASLILGYLREGAQAQTEVDLEGTLKRAVLCVPANFEANKREELLRAARDMVGLDVRLLEEPVAAAIAYAAERDADTKILVYDLGGGTFDVSILQVKASVDTDVANRFQVLGKGGISKLGGDDFDRRLMEKLAEKIKAASGIDILDLHKDQGVSLKKIKGAQQKLKEIAEKAKIELSEAETVVLDEPAIIKDEAGKEYGLKEESITRLDFQQATEDLLLETKKKVEETLKEAFLGMDEIDRIILVGGSTRMFMVKEMIKNMFGKEPWSEIDPTTIVARGAALYGAGGILEQNRTSHFLGIELLNRRFGKLIEKNSLLPAKVEKVYQTAEMDPEAVRISIYQSLEPVNFATEKPCTFLGEFFLTIPEDKRDKKFRNIKVYMEMTDENLLKVRAELEDERGVFHEAEIKK
jgi:molecular chaperone DnaK (HSP70)